MVRIGGGVFPDIKEPDYLGERGYTIDDKAGKVKLMCFKPSLALASIYRHFLLDHLLIFVP